MTVRLIPRLDIKGPNLVKGIQFEGLRVLGKPQDFARSYYEQGADELIYMDVVASLYGRNSLVEFVELTAREIFVPLTVGGGLRSVDDIRAVLRAGADKVSINTAAVRSPGLINEAARVFGSSTIVVSIEAMKQEDGSYEAYVDYGREKTGVDAIEWARKAADLGAGELMVTSINCEGKGQGIDLELTREIADSVPIPIIASGGVGRVEHVAEAIVEGRPNAVSFASILHYNFVRLLPYEQGEFSGEGNIEFLRGGAGAKGPSRIADATMPEIKDYLIEHGIECRPRE